MAVPVTAAMLAFAAVAFACTPQATIKLTPPSGPAGTNITVTGSSLTPGTTVKVFWGGISSGRVVGTTTAKSDNTMSLTFQVPADAPNGQTIVAANQTKDGVALGSPANALFNVNTPGGATVATAAVTQNDPPAASDGAAALAPITDTATAATPAPVTATRTRPAPTQTAAATRTPAKQTAVAPAVTPAPPAADSTPAVQPAAPTPAPAVTPAAPAAPEATPAAPARRSVMVSMAGDGSNGSPVLAIALVGIGLVLALGASAVVLAGRRDRKAPAKAQR